MVTMRTCCFVGLIFIINCIQFSQGVECYSCSYQFSGHDGAYGYDCVNNTQNFVQTSKLQCQEPYQCSIDATFTENFETLLSVSRSCKVPPSLANGCVGESTRPSCAHHCLTNLCNDIDGDLRAKYGIGIDDGNNSTAKPLLSLTLYSLVLSSVAWLMLKE